MFFLLTESQPPPLPSPAAPPQLCLRQRSGRCRVFPEKKRWAALHLLSHFLSSCLHFHFFAYFCESSALCECSGHAASAHTRRESYYPGALNTCTYVSVLLLKNGGRLILRLSLICLVILNFTILKLVLTSKFCSQEYKFTLFFSVPSQASFTSRLCWGEKKQQQRSLE